MKQGTCFLADTSSDLGYYTLCLYKFHQECTTEDHLNTAERKASSLGQASDSSLWFSC